MTKKVG